MTYQFISVLSPLVEKLRQFKQESSTLEAWLKEREADFEACGTIGANLERCGEQSGILEVMNEGFVSKRLEW